MIAQHPNIPDVSFPLSEDRVEAHVKAGWIVYDESAPAEPEPVTKTTARAKTGEGKTKETSKNE